jgi:hypothetical protein
LEKRKVPINLDRLIDPERWEQTKDFLLDLKRRGYKIVMPMPTPDVAMRGIVFDVIPPDESNQRKDKQP